MLPSLYFRAAGEREGAKAPLAYDYSHQKRPQDFLTNAVRFFVKHKLHKKCGVTFQLAKKPPHFLQTEKEAPRKRSFL